MKPIPQFLFFLALALPTFAQTPQPVKLPPMKNTDVVATVEGQPITRRELTYFWLQTDPKTKIVLGDLLASLWKRDKGALGSYSVTNTVLFQKLYGGDPTAYASILSNLITNKLVGIVAQRQKITVTQKQAQALGHEMLDTVRKQGGSTLSDDALLQEFNVPRDIFEKDMVFRLQVERLLEKKIAKRNGHPIAKGDWIVTRELFAAYAAGATLEETELNAKAAKSRLETWLAEVKSGKLLEQAARDKNENTTKETGGSRGAMLRGTGTPALESAIFALKPGEISAPIRAANGWYVFQLEKASDTITAEERKQGWQTVINAKQPELIIELRKAAKIKSVIELPPPATVPQ